LTGFNTIFDHLVAVYLFGETMHIKADNYHVDIYRRSGHASICICNIILCECTVHRSDTAFLDTGCLQHTRN